MASTSLLGVALFCVASLSAQAPMAMPPQTSMAGEDKVEAPVSCAHCGMNRTMFAHSRMVLIYEDGTRVGTCSLHCTATELGMSQGKPVKSLQVADYSNTKKLVDAKTAIWVIGGRQKGVMTKEPKWAFEKKPDAELFIQMNGGKLAAYEEAMALAAQEAMP